jgi:hypothetical protein
MENHCGSVLLALASFVQAKPEFESNTSHSTESSAKL